MAATWRDSPNATRAWPSSSRSSVAHTLPAVVDTPNVYPDLSGSGVDRGMIDSAVQALGARRLLWACDLTMETGLAKLRALEVIGLTADELQAVRWTNAARLFPPNSFPRCDAA